MKVAAVVLWISFNFSIFLLWLTKDIIVYDNVKKVNWQVFKLAPCCYKDSSVLKGFFLSKFLIALFQLNWVQSKTFTSERII